MKSISQDSSAQGSVEPYVVLAGEGVTGFDVLMTRVNLAVVAKSPIGRIKQFTDARGWKNLRLLSSSDSTYNRDYHSESSDGAQWPALNVFVRRDEAIYHSYNAELLYAPFEPGHDGRHVDLIWPLWNLFDLTPEGRGENWYPRLSY